MWNVRNKFIMIMCTGLRTMAPVDSCGRTSFVWSNDRAKAHDHAWHCNHCMKMLDQSPSSSLFEYKDLLINPCSFLVLTPGLGSCSLPPRSSINKNLMEMSICESQLFYKQYSGSFFWELYAYANSALLLTAFININVNKYGWDLAELWMRSSQNQLFAVLPIR
jgi:hypothetical protein